MAPARNRIGFCQRWQSVWKQERRHFASLWNLDGHGANVYAPKPGFPVTLTPRNEAPYLQTSANARSSQRHEPRRSQPTREQFGDRGFCGPKHFTSGRRPTTRSRSQGLHPMSDPASGHEPPVEHAQCGATHTAAKGRSHPGVGGCARG